MAHTSGTYTRPYSTRYLYAKQGLPAAGTVERNLRGTGTVLFSIGTFIFLLACTTNRVLDSRHGIQKWRDQTQMDLKTATTIGS